jgi:UDP-glucose 4-epimerase
MRLLVTGGAGYIGSIVAQRLLARGDDVTVLDSLYRGHREAVPAGAAFVEADLLDAAAIADVLRGGFDGVVHFAALSLVGESVEHPERYWRGNVVGALNLLDAMRAADVRRLVFSSTAATYGEPPVELITEETPNAPVNAYGNSKLTIDRMLADEARAHGLAAVSLRYFNVAGASGPLGEDHHPETHLIPLVLQAAAGKRPSVAIFGTDYPTPDGTAVRDYVHVEDLATAHLLALDHAAPGRHDIFNLGSESGNSVREVIEAARRVTGREIVAVEEARRAGDPPRLVASNARARAELGWAPERSLDDMVRDAWAWHQAHPDGYSARSG